MCSIFPGRKFDVRNDFQANTTTVIRENSMIYTDTALTQKIAILKAALDKTEALWIRNIAAIRCDYLPGKPYLKKLKKLWGAPPSRGDKGGEGR
jgi:hypothetical protein